MPSIILKSIAYGDQIAIIEGARQYSYRALREQACSYAASIRALSGPDPGPVLFIAPAGFTYVALQWGIWLAGGIAVPVHTAHPKEEIRYLIGDTGSNLLLYENSCAAMALSLADSGCRIVAAEALREAGWPELPPVDPASDALMIYTSGTTGKPKGVVMSHNQIDAQLRSLSEAWGWSSSDRILNVLPMHHVHGVINITCCALYNGAVLEMQPGFDPARVAERMCSGELSLFMAVPTIYHKLIRHFEELPAGMQQRWQEGMRSMRLMVSGSAALPVSVLQRWLEISGHTLLERYGMTETGMALSNPLQGLRKPGYVGRPLPYVSVMLADETGNPIEEADSPGELWVKGDTVFARYWRRPEETARSFRHGWFMTGDVAARDTEGCYRILGRNSSDIIKSGGYKISALEIEHVLLEHPDIQECAVVALASDEWGELIAAAIVGDVAELALQNWLKERLAPYKLPRRYVRADSLPRNAMGKVIKTEVKKLFAG